MYAVGRHDRKIGVRKIALHSHLSRASRLVEPSGAVHRVEHRNTPVPRAGEEDVVPGIREDADIAVLAGVVDRFRIKLARGGVGIVVKRIVAGLVIFIDLWL